jgi:hypothetical protein
VTRRWDIVRNQLIAPGAEAVCRVPANLRAVGARFRAPVRGIGGRNDRFRFRTPTGHRFAIGDPRIVRVPGIGLRPGSNGPASGLPCGEAIPGNARA